MIRGRSCNFAWLAALAAAYLLALCPAVPMAQNNAESKPPKPPVEEKNNTDKQPEKESSGNIAEKAPLKKSGSDNGKKEEPVNLPDPEKGTEAKPNGAKPEPPPVVPEDEGNQPGQGTGVDDVEEPLDAEQQPDKPAEKNIAEGVSTTQNKPEEKAVPPPVIKPPVIPAANTAEKRPTGTSANNTAEAGSVEAESEIAEPPTPHFSLPSPDDVAGRAEGYVAPKGVPLDAPALENAPQRQSLDAFVQPKLDYLSRRPLPDTDILETSEEELARSFEESLKLLNLAQETRPDSGIKVPLPSGVMTFKASDAFEFDRRNKILRFIGNAELVFDNIAIWADLIEVDDGAATAYAKGYVGIQEKDEILFCDEAYVNYDTNTLELFWVEGNSGGPKIEGAVFFEADRAYGSFDELMMEKVKVTTCEPFCGGPTEVHMQAEKMKFRRDKSIVLYNVYLYARNQKYFYVPMLAFPLDHSQPIKQGESDLEQNYGYQRTTGWFAKFAYTYSVRYAENVKRALLGVSRIELSEKQGPGFGIRQDFLVPSLGVATVVGFYQQGWPDTPLRRFYFHPLGKNPGLGYLSGEDFKSSGEKQNANFKFSLNQELNLSRSLSGKLSVERTDTIIPARNEFGNDKRDNRWSNRLSLNYGKNDTTASISANQSVSITGGFTSNDGTQEPSSERSTNSGAARYNTNLTKDLKFNFSQDYSSNKGSSGNQNLPANQEGTLRMGLNWVGKRDSEFEGYTAKLGYLEQGIDYDQDNNTTDRNLTIRKELPSLQINLPRDLINDGAYFNNFTINIDNLVTGRRRTPESSFRGKLQARGQDNLKFSPSSSLTTNMGIEQYWYDDGNAQYSLQPRVSYSYNPKSWWKLNASWNMTYHQGVTLPPVQGDRKTYSNSSGINLTMSNYRSWRWNLRSGYDFRNHAVTPLRSSLTWDPNRTFGITQSMTYNLRDHTFSPSRMSGYFRSPYVDDNGYYNWLLKLTWDHDIEHRMRTTRFDLRWLKRWGNGWTSDVQGGFRDGSDVSPDISDEFVSDYIKKISVRKTTCCTTIEAAWRTGINSFEVKVFLNALPQYPLREESYHTFGDKWNDDLFFPGKGLQQDIMQDMFGIQQSLF